jgi:murein DD-endopeptidase MepM/ murein hydrolase activator NlpD
MDSFRATTWIQILIAAIIAVMLACPLAAEEWYTVQKSDTLWSISRKFGLKVADIQQANGLTSESIQAGQRLRIPTGQKPAQTAPQAQQQSKPAQTAAPPSAGTTIRHVVASGESLWGISRRYGVSVDAIKRDNALKSDAIQNGQTLLVRGAAKQTAATAAAKPAPAKASERTFLWPIKGSVVEKFGVQQKGIINGITIAAAQKEAEVHAAASGVVTYSGPLRGYGQVVIIRHDGVFYSVYANLSQIWAEKGNTIVARTPVGKAGFVQSAGCYGVHFQLHRQSSAVNPLSYLAG